MKVTVIFLVMEGGSAGRRKPEINWRILSDAIASVIRRDVRKLAPGNKIDTKEIQEILADEVLKRDIVEGEEASKAINSVRRIARKTTKLAPKPKHKKPEDSNEGQSNDSNQGV